jgi:hypothetical protein
MSVVIELAYQMPPARPRVPQPLTPMLPRRPSKVKAV